MTRSNFDGTLSSGVVSRMDESNRFLFVLCRPDGRAHVVVDAQTFDAAWTIATGCDDEKGIAERKEQGWRMYPCTVTWRVE